MTEEEHLRYHLEVSLTGCGVPHCTAGEGIALHFRALNELPEDWFCPQCGERLDSMADCSCGFVWQQALPEKDKVWLPELDEADLDL